MAKLNINWLIALATPLFYLAMYTPYGMDTTDFGYFYGYAFRILEGQMPYRDFFYIKPAFPLYWHAFWMWLAPEKFQILFGKMGFVAEMLLLSWLCALYLAKVFDLNKMRLPLPVLATCGFVFSIHTFPHMPWHTADGALFCSAGLFFAVYSHPLLCGLFLGLAVLTKQSFLLVPFAMLVFLWIEKRKHCIYFIISFGSTILLFLGWLIANNAFNDFNEMTTGQLAISEAIDAGILIYLRQNWLVPAFAFLPWIICRLFAKKLPPFLSPLWLYLFILLICCSLQVFTEKAWIGYGLSWPTFFMLLGVICFCFPKFFIDDYYHFGIKKYCFESLCLALPLLVSWSCAISGGYKIPAFFAIPLVFSFFLMQLKFSVSVKKLAYATLIAGLIIFGIGWQYPYTFPQRPLQKKDLVFNAGEVYKKATGVFVDKDMFERLKELKHLREKYGPNYKTLPGFTLSYYLNNDKPVCSSDWLINWEINGKTEKVYKELADSRTTVFMERDQLETKKADGYDRAAYDVPQKIRKLWKKVDETPHFVVFQAP